MTESLVCCYMLLYVYMKTKRIVFPSIIDSLPLRDYLLNYSDYRICDEFVTHRLQTKEQVKHSIRVVYNCVTQLFK
jgi:hypothetical protein